MYLLDKIVCNGLWIDSSTRCPDARLEGEPQEQSFS